MTIGIARLVLFLPGSHSLKEKRMVLRRIKDLVQQKFNAAVAEVGDNDVWQRAAVGIAVVGRGESFVGSMLDEVIRFVRDKAEVTNVERELQTFSDTEPLTGTDFKHWEG